MKKRIIFIMGIVFVILGVGTLVINNLSNKFIKLDYKEVMEKVENKDSFVLCVSATDCVHCNSYKPKLKKIANNYKTEIFYIDVDTLSDDDYDSFKQKFSFDGGTPVTILIRNGEEKTTATRIEGDVSSEKIINKLKKNGFIK